MARQKLLGQVRTEIRRRNYSYRTEKAYPGWIKRFVKFHHLTHPAKLNEDDVVAFLNWLAVDRTVAASTQNQALCAIIFLYDHVLKSPLSKLQNLQRTKETQHLPVVFSSPETATISELFRSFWGIRMLKQR